jgi:hypothetical protein
MVGLGKQGQGIFRQWYDSRVFDMGQAHFLSSSVQANSISCLHGPDRVLGVIQRLKDYNIQTRSY